MSSNKKSPSRPIDKAEWLLLTSVQHAERRERILGSVVPRSAQYNPFDNYSPHWNDPILDERMTVDNKQVSKKKVLQDTTEKLWMSKDKPTGQAGATRLDNPAAYDTPVQLNDILAGRIAAKTKGMRAAVTDLFNSLIRKDVVEDVNIESGSVRRYTIDNPAGKVRDNLMPCEPWKEQLQKLFDNTSQQKSRFMLVTGILICENLKVRWKRNAESNYEAGMKVNGNAVLPAFHHLPNPELAGYLDSRFEFDQRKSTAENVFATCKHDVIFAVRYNELSLTFEKRADAKEPNSFMKFVFRPAKPGTIRNATLGEVVLGTGITAYAHASEDMEERNDGGNDEGEQDGVDWFYGHPAPHSESEAVDQNNAVTSARVHRSADLT
ncbi:MAG: hypothetical protein Q9160_006254 [Pyrenula sp. 1 TL-2023]